MRDLVREQEGAGGGVRNILTGPEDDVAPDGERPRVDGLRRLLRPAIGVQAHVVEASAQSRLQERAGGGVGWLTWGRERLPHERRSRGDVTGTANPALHGRCGGRRGVA